MLFARKDKKNQKLAAMSMKIFDVILLSQVCPALQIPMSNKSRIEFILLKCWSEFNFMPVNLQAQKLHHTYAFAD